MNCAFPFRRWTIPIASSLFTVAVPVLCASAYEAKADTQESTEKSKGSVLTGTILDDWGKPVPGVKVVLYSGIATRWKGQEAVTDAKGEYRFDPLQTGAMMGGENGGPGSWYVGMQLEHAVYASADGQSWWDVTVSMAPGHLERKDFAMVRGGTVRGVVLNPGTMKGSSIDMRIQSAKDEKRSYNRYVTSGEDGKFVETALFPGRYFVDVNSSRLTYPVLGELVVEAGKETAVTFYFPDHNDGPTLTGMIRDEEGNAVKGATIVLYACGAGREERHGQDATTDSDGRYMFAPMQTGRITLGSGGKPATFSVRMRLFHESKCSDDGASYWDFTLPVDTGYSEVKDVRLIPGGSVHGIVRDAKTGEPIKNIGLRIRAAEGEKRNFERGFANDNHGEFRQGALFPGKYLIETGSPVGKQSAEVLIEGAQESEVLVNLGTGG